MLKILAQAMTPVEREYTDLELSVSGTLPPALNGVLYRNGLLSELTAIAEGVRRDVEDTHQRH